MVFGLNSDATEEPGEPLHAGVPGFGSVWYRWTPSHSQTVEVHVTDANESLLLTIFSGSKLTNLKTVALVNEQYSFERYISEDSGLTVRFAATADESYFIAIAQSSQRTNRTSFTLSWKGSYIPPAQQPPPHDNLANARSISGKTGTVHGTIANATLERNERHTADSETASVWYVWVAPANGRYSFECGLRFQGYWSTRDGTPSWTDLHRWIIHGDTYASFQARSGDRLYLAVISTDEKSDDFSLKWKLASTTGNDDFYQATPIQGLNGSYQQNNRLATRQLGEPSHYAHQSPDPFIDHSLQRTLWYRWIAPVTGYETFTVNSASTTNIARMAIYTGSNLKTLSAPAVPEIGARDDKSFNTTVAVRAGNEYKIVLGITGLGGELRLQWRPATPVTPANDNRLTAQLLEGRHGSVPGTTQGATAEPGEPQALPTVWYRWIAPANGQWSFQVQDQSSDTRLSYTAALYEGENLEELVSRGTMAVGSRIAPSSMNLRARRGHKYWLVVAGVEGLPVLKLNFQVRWEALATGPANDNWQKAAPLRGKQGSLEGNLLTATRQAGEPIVAIPANPDFARSALTVWYAWAPTHSGTALVTMESKANIILDVFTGAALTGLRLHKSGYFESQTDSSTASPNARGTLRWRTQTGTTYWIRASGTPQPFRLEWQLIVTPPNDAFQDAQVLVREGTIRASTVGSTLQAGEPFHDGLLGAHGSIWYSFIPKFSGRYSFRTDEVLFDWDRVEFHRHRTMAVYTASAQPNQLHHLEPVANSVSASGLVFNGRVGQQYYLAVDGSPAEFSLTLQAAPANDNWSRAQAIKGESGLIHATTLGASREPNEPLHLRDAAGYTLWYRWVAPRTGRLWLSAFSPIDEHMVIVYQGNWLSALHRLGPVTLRGSRTFYQVVKGETYFFVADNYLEGTERDIALTWAMNASNDEISTPVTLSRTSGITSGSLVAAGWAPEEPPLSGLGANADGTVWYSWKAPVAGPIFFALDTIPGTKVLAYRRENFDLTPMPRLQTADPPDLATFGFRAAKDVTYYIQVLGRSDSGFKLLWFQQLAGDDFERAIQIQGESGQISFSSIGTTSMVPDPRDVFAVKDGTVWFRWQPPKTGRARFVLTLIDKLAVFTIKRDGQRERVPATSPDDTGTFYFNVSRHQEYFIVVGGQHRYNNVGLTWAMAPANDLFANAQQLSGANGAVIANLMEASIEPLEPHHGNYPPEHSIWYQWKAPRDGTVSWKLTPEYFAASLGVYQGTSLTNLTPIFTEIRRDSPDTLSLAWTATFRARQGQTYYLAVDGILQDDPYIPLEDWGFLSMRWGYSALNDDHDTAQDITGVAGQLQGSTVTATSANFYETAHSLSHGVWFRWTAPAGGAVAFDTAGSEFPSGLMVFVPVANGRLEPAARAAMTNLLDNSADLVISAKMGQVFYICLAGEKYFEPDNGQYQLSWYRVPTNDNFAQAQRLKGDQGEITGSNTNATGERESSYGYGEPYHAGNPVTASVWYQWKPTKNGEYTFDTLGTGFDTVLAVYSGESIVNLRERTANDDIGNSLVQSSVTISADTRFTYYIAVDGYRGETGNFVLRWARKPDNDNLTAKLPILLTGVSGSIPVSNAGATRQQGETASSGELGHFPGIVTAKSVWYHYLPDGDGMLRLHLEANHQWVLAAYRGTDVEHLTQLSSRTTARGGGDVMLNIPANQSVFIALDGVRGDSGAGILHWEFVPLSRPNNDQVEKAHTLPGAQGSIAGDNTGATRQIGEPLHYTSPTGVVSTLRSAASIAPSPFDTNTITDLATRKYPVTPNFYTGNAGGRSVWYKWTTPANWKAGDVCTVWLENASFAGVPALYRRAPGSDHWHALQPLVILGQHSIANRLQWKPATGQTYFIAVDGYDGAGGRFALRWSRNETHTRAPANDSFETPRLLSGSTGTIKGDSRGATRQPGEPIHAKKMGSGSVWFTWTAPSRGQVTFNTAGSSYDTLLGVYKGSVLKTLADIQSNDDDVPWTTSALTFTAKAGHVYRIALDGYTTGNYTLGWKFTPSAASTLNPSNRRF